MSNKGESERAINELQVNKAHYTFENYSSERRYISYYHQIKNTMAYIERNQAKRILIAGKGDGIVPKILEAYSDLHDLQLTIHTFDFAKDLKPDYLGDLLEIDKIVTSHYDVILCCQTLEHIPLEEARRVISMMRGLTNVLILSVPYNGFTIRGCLKVPILKEFQFCLKIPPLWTKRSMVDSRHYWELGYSLSLKEFKKRMIEAGYRVRSAYILPKDGFKTFLILESNKQ